MAKFRSWNEEKNRFYYFEDGKYCYEITRVVFCDSDISKFNWQNAEQIIKPITVDESALGCGLEDVGITDRYESMMYGFNQALEIIKNELNIVEVK